MFTSIAPCHKAELCACSESALFCLLFRRRVCGDCVCVSSMSALRSKWWAFLLQTRCPRVMLRGICVYIYCTSDQGRWCSILTEKYKLSRNQNVTTLLLVFIFDMNIDTSPSGLQPPTPNRWRPNKYRITPFMLHDRNLYIHLTIFLDIQSRQRRISITEGQKVELRSNIGRFPLHNYGVTQLTHPQTAIIS